MHRNDIKALIASNKASNKAKKAEAFNLREKARDLNDSVRRTQTDQFKVLCENKSIAINSDLAVTLLKNRGSVFDDEQTETLQQYIAACNAYRMLQHNFENFYQSSAFELVCESLLEEGMPNSWSREMR